VEFRLTYAGPLLAERNDKRRFERSLHVHNIRRQFHRQLAMLWEKHPNLNYVFEIETKNPTIPNIVRQKFVENGFTWIPLVTKVEGVICKLDVLLLRPGPPGHALADIDNRLKTLFDALRKPHEPTELGSKSSRGQQVPGPEETPFYVLLEDDKLITHVAVATEMLLEPIDNCPPEDAVRLVIGVTVRPYHVTQGNSHFV
jgi:hypothetical protein